MGESDYYWSPTIYLEHLSLKMKESNILMDASHYAEDLLTGLSNKYCFHNLKHTHEVVAASKTIAKYCNMNPQELERVLIACWFHDTGFSVSPFNHEYHSAVITKEFLKLKQYPISGINTILGCIKATKLPQRPTNKLEAIVCDADMFHLSTDNYWSKNKLLKNEREYISQGRIRNDQWCYENLNFLGQHRYHTKYGKMVLSRRKEALLKQNVKKLEALKLS